MTEFRYDGCPGGHHVAGDDVLMERSRGLFGLPDAEAAAMVRAFRALPPHAMDEAMVITCRRPGDSCAALNAQYAGGGPDAKRDAMSRTVPVKYRTVRALAAASARRDWDFCRDQDRLQFEILANAAPTDDPTAALVAAIRLLIARGQHGIVHTTALVENAKGDPVRLPFSYTVGLPRVAGVADLCIHMLDEERVEPSFVSAIAEMQRTGIPPHGGTFKDVAEGLRVAALRVDPGLVREAMPAIAEAADPKQVVEMIIPDRHGRFPWDPGCSPGVANGQRILGVVPASTH